MRSVKSKQDENGILFQLFFSIFIALFGAVYEIFSHEVYSYYMIYAFIIPLILGVALPVLLRKAGAFRINALTIRLWNYGVISFTIGSVIMGVLEIYGTTNRLAIVYPIIGGALILVAVISHLLQRGYSRKTAHSEDLAGTICK